MVKVFTQWCDHINNHTSYIGIQIKNTKKFSKKKFNIKN